MDFFLNPIRNGLYIAALKTADVFAPSSQSIETPAKRTLKRAVSLPAFKSTTRSGDPSSFNPQIVVTMTPEQWAHEQHQQTVRENVSRAVDEEIKLAKNRAEYEEVVRRSTSSRTPTLEEEAIRYNLTPQEAARLPAARAAIARDATVAANRVYDSQGRLVDGVSYRRQQALIARALKKEEEKARKIETARQEKLNDIRKKNMAAAMLKVRAREERVDGLRRDYAKLEAQRIMAQRNRANEVNSSTRTPPLRRSSSLPR
jgi:hypothetical protein